MQIAQQLDAFFQKSQAEGGNPSKRIYLKRSIWRFQSSPERTPQAFISLNPENEAVCRIHVQSDARGGEWMVKIHPYGLFTSNDARRGWGAGGGVFFENPKIFFKTFFFFFFFVPAPPKINRPVTMTLSQAGSPVEGDPFYRIPRLHKGFNVFFRFRRRNCRGWSMRNYGTRADFWEVGGKMAWIWKAKVVIRSLWEETFQGPFKGKICWSSRKPQH